MVTFGLGEHRVTVPALSAHGHVSGPNQNEGLGRRLQACVFPLLSPSSQALVLRNTRFQRDLSQENWYFPPLIYIVQVRLDMRSSADDQSSQIQFGRGGSQSLSDLVQTGRTSSEPKAGLYRDDLTPHPNKFGTSESYFDEHTLAAPDNADPIYNPSYHIWDQSAIDAHSGVASSATRPHLEPWSSSCSQDLHFNPRAERTLSSLEAGDDRPKRGTGVVSSLIRLGLGQGGGSRRTSDACSSLDNDGRRGRSFSFASMAGFDEDAEKGGSDPGSQHSYRDKVLLKRGRKRRDITRHVECEYIRFA